MRTSSGVTRAKTGRLLLAAAPVVVLTAAFGLNHSFDFHVFWAAGGSIVHGHSPYPSLASLDADTGKYYVYPPFVALMTVPLSVLPFPVAAVIFAALSIGAIGLSMRILGVEDWRCFPMSFLWIATALSISFGTVGPLLVLGLALAWRYRSHALLVALAVGVVICTKLFLWPIAVWLVATRRLGAAVRAVVFAFGLAFASWAVIGFDGLRGYSPLLRKLTRIEQDRSFTFAAFSHWIGLPGTASRVLFLTGGAAVLAAIFLLARRPDGDRRAFVAAIGASLFLSPLVWLHYLVVLVVPVALTSPRLSRLWVLPALLFWTDPDVKHARWPLVWAFVITAAVFVIACRERSVGQRPLGSRISLPQALRGGLGYAARVRA